MLRIRILLILCAAIVPVILSLTTEDVDYIVNFCRKDSKLFSKIEKQFTRKTERGPKEPDFFGDQIKELQFKVYERELRQRVFECITNLLGDVSLDLLNQSPNYQDLVNECKAGQIHPRCDPNYPYRTIDGTCNNLENPTWGSVLVCAKRLLPAYYEGASDYRKSKCKGQALPSPRHISLQYFQDEDKPAKFTSSHLVYFGQFISHDITDTPATFVGDKPLDCCSNYTTNVQHPQCDPILLENDPFYAQHRVTCHNFVRAAMCDTCSVGPRTHMYAATAYLDLSLVYGLTDKEAKKIRRFDGSGQMKVQESTFGDLLPVDETIEGFRCSRAANISKDDHGEKCKKNEDCEPTEACNKPKGKCYDICGLTNLCGTGAVCTTRNHEFQCHCPAGTTGDPYIECSVIHHREKRSTEKCKKNEDCEPTEACDNSKEKCYDICSQPSLCGTGAICTTHNHNLVCHCPAGTTGDPYIECSVIQPEDDEEQNRKKRDIFEKALNCIKREGCDFKDVGEVRNLKMGCVFEKALNYIIGEDEKDYCFKAGDRRVNQHPILMGYQTVFLREHNRVAAKLKEMNPHWSEEKIYQETRKILTAEYQVIVYKEFLPFLLGKNFMHRYDLNIKNANGTTEYDPTVDPTLVTEFTSAAYRLHSMVNNKVGIFGPNGRSSLRNLYNDASPIYHGRMEEIFTSLNLYSWQDYDRHVVEDLSQYLYKELRGDYGFDLTAVNIQRGRDVGLPTYVEVLKYYSDEELDIKDFDDLAPHMNLKNIQKLKKMYCDVNDIDLWVGLDSEHKLPDKQISVTACKIIAEQFKKLKDGDRFYFEHKGQFNDEQRRTLKQASLSKLICQNTNVLILAKNCMAFPSISNPPVPCALLPEVDLEKWREV